MLASWSTCSSGRPAATASRIVFSPSSSRCVRSSRLRAISRMSGLAGDSIAGTANML